MTLPPIDRSFRDVTVCMKRSLGLGLGGPVPSTLPAFLPAPLYIICQGREATVERGTPAAARTDGMGFCYPERLNTSTLENYIGHCSQVSLLVRLPPDPWHACVCHCGMDGGGGGLSEHL